jgi:hypothetical protein
MSADQSSNLVPPTSEDNDETFTTGTYNGISVIKRDKDGFINATAMCKQFGKRFAKINENKAWKAYYREFKTQNTPLPDLGGHISSKKQGSAKARIS